MKFLFLLFLFLLSINGFAQQTKIATLTITNIKAAYVDRPGDLYIQQKNNTITKFDIDGKLINELAFDNSPTIFDPRDGARMFVYSSKTQQCSFFSNETKLEFPIEEFYAVDPILVCSSGDQKLWILDRADWSLKKINPAQSEVLTETLIDQVQFSKPPVFTFLREYQNFLFLIEKNSGILIFNSLGIQIKKIIAPEIEYINFLGEELYFKQHNKLIFYDLFDTSTRELPIDPTCKIELLTDTRVFLIFDKKVDIFSIR